MVTNGLILLSTPPRRVLWHHYTLSSPHTPLPFFTITHQPFYNPLKAIHIIVSKVCQNYDKCGTNATFFLSTVK